MESRITFLISILALLIAVLPAAGFAEEDKAEKIKEVIDKTTPEGRAAFQTHRMKNTLGLDQEQIDKVREINLKYARKVETTVGASEGELRKLEEMREIGEEKDRELKAILSADQYDKYLALKEEMREKMMESAGS
ncbi:MAG: hypothetical protein U9R74_15620 [Pseudomonadota bacterium]|nr:hypothetical protein [Pseudomonadota bacterium]